MTSENVILEQIDTDNAILSDGKKSYLFNADMLKIFRLNGYPHNGSRSSFREDLERDMRDMKSAAISACVSDDMAARKDEYYRSSSDIRILTLNVAHQCNMVCRYCFADKGIYKNKSSVKFLSSDKAIQAIEYFLQYNGKSDALKYIDFSGGEPLLNFDVVRDCIDFVTRKSPNGIQTGIVTNGTLLNEEILAYLKRKNVNLTISIDGDRYSHDSNRKLNGGEGSYDRIMENISDFLDRNRQSISVRSTITPLNMDLVGNFSHIEDSGFRDYSFDIAFGDFDDPEIQWTEKRLVEYDSRYGLFAEYLLKRLLSGTIPRFTGLIGKLLRIHKQEKHIYPCRMAKNLLVVTPDGEYYPCYKLAEMERYQIGNISRGIDEIRRLELFPRLVSEKEDCRQCWARYLCGGGCAAESFLENNCDLYTDKWICGTRKISWKWFLWLYVQLKQSNFDFNKLLIGGKKDVSLQR